MKAYLTLLLFSSCQIALGTEDCSQCIDGIATIMDIHKSNNDFIKIDAAFLKILCPTYRTFSFCQDDGKVAFWEAAAWTNDIYEDFCNSVESCNSFSVVDQQSCVDISNAFGNFLLSDEGNEQLKANLELSQDANEVQVVLEIVLPAWTQVGLHKGNAQACSSLLS